MTMQAPTYNSWPSQTTHMAHQSKAFAIKAAIGGHDGILIRGNVEMKEVMGGEEYSADVWVAFHPEQIKSAIGNNGQYDFSNPNICA